MLMKRRLIVIVDNGADTRAGLYAALDQTGYLVATCCSAFEALRYVAEQKPDLMLCGARLWDMDGMELLEKVRATSPNTRVIVIGRKGDWPLHMEALDSGGDDLVCAPIDREKILQAIRRSLESPAR